MGALMGNFRHIVDPRGRRYSAMSDFNNVTQLLNPQSVDWCVISPYGNFKQDIINRTLLT